MSDPTSTLQIPALDNTLAGSKPIPYTPVCSSAGSFRVCVHPAFRGYLPTVTSALAAVTTELAGLPGTPSRAVEVSQGRLPAAVFQSNADGEIKDGVYEFSLSNAIALVQDAGMLKDSLQQDIVHAVIVGHAAARSRTTAASPSRQSRTGCSGRSARGRTRSADRRMAPSHSGSSSSRMR